MRPAVSSARIAALERRRNGGGRMRRISICAAWTSSWPAFTTAEDFGLTGKHRSPVRDGLAPLGRAPIQQALHVGRRELLRS